MSDLMERRHFIAGLGWTGAASSLLFGPLARGQPGDRMRRIGVLSALATDDREWHSNIGAFLDRLRPLGWAENRNFRIEARHAAGDAERMRAYAKELVALAPDVIVVESNPGLDALRRETRTVPLVFVQVADPVGSGFVDSLARPGGNITGFINFDPPMGSKWLEILKEAAPGLKRALVLLHAQTPANVAMARAAEAAGPAFGVAVTQSGVVDASGIEQAITKFAGEPDGGLIVMPHVVTAGNRALIAELAARYRMPTIGAFRFMARSGCLMSYGVDPVDLFQRAAMYVDRILRGTKPADLPVQAPVKFELVVNLKTAKALGLEIDPILLSRADQVIE